MGWRGFGMGMGMGMQIGIGIARVRVRGRVKNGVAGVRFAFDGRGVGGV